MKSPALPLIQEEPATTSASLGEIKDAYSKWLKDLELDPTRKRKKKKSKRVYVILSDEWRLDVHISQTGVAGSTCSYSAALRHLAQPTESSTHRHSSTREAESAAKLTSTKLALPPETNAAIIAQDGSNRRRFRALADEANCVHFQYEPPWIPGIGFFGLLAAHAKTVSLQSLGSRPDRADMKCFPVHVPPTVLRRRDQNQDDIVFMFTIEDSPDRDGTKTRKNSAPVDQVSLETAPTYTLQFHFFASRELYLRRLSWIVRTLTAGDAPPSIAPSDNNDDAHLILALRKTSASQRPNEMKLEPLRSVQATHNALESLFDDEHNTMSRTPTIGIRWTAIQAYIVCKGSSPSRVANVATPSGKAWIARAVYRKRDQGTSNVWILTSADNQWASTEWPDDSKQSPPCQIVKCVNGQSWKEPRAVAQALSQFLGLHLRAALSELVVDLLQDKTGRWWMLQVKAFQSRPAQMSLASLSVTTSRVRSAPDRLETMSVTSLASTKSTFSGSSLISNAKWKCAGKFCSAEDEEQVRCEGNSNGASASIIDHYPVTANAARTTEPSAFLTKKELLSCDFFDQYQRGADMSLGSGCDGFGSALAFFLQHQLRKRDRTTLYESQPLCLNCARRYHELREQYHAEITPPLKLSTDAANAKRMTSKVRLPCTQSMKALGGLPRTLPPVHSMSSLPGRVSAVSTAVPAESSNVASAPSYLADLENIERMLAHQDELYIPTTISAPATGTPTAPLSQPSPHATTPPPAASMLSWLTDGKRDQHAGNRVDEMWQSLSFKPLHGTGIASSSAAPQYNTFSLQHALQQSDELATTRTKQLAPSMSKERQASVPAHTVSISDCKRIFADETYREALVCDAVEHLICVDRQVVNFVVLPCDSDDPTDAHQISSSASSLARMALSSLYLDVAQALDQRHALGTAVTTAGMPPIVEDRSSGCIVLTMSPSLLVPSSTS